jgi:hypothetical protein
LSEGDSQWNKLLKDCLAAQRPIPTWVDVSVSDAWPTRPWTAPFAPFFLNINHFKTD